MLIQVQDQLHQQRIVELLETSVFSDPDHLKAAVELYSSQENANRSNPPVLMGWSLDDEIIGIIGYEMKLDVMKIHHIAVDPEFRGLGYGRGMVSELIDLLKPRKIIAETDEDAVDFYRNIGFTVISLGEQYPNAERFVCTFETDPALFDPMR